MKPGDLQKAWDDYQYELESHGGVDEYIKDRHERREEARRRLVIAVSDAENIIKRNSAQHGW
jgi:hypothetical protein